jgi:hypothetical protein
MAASVIRNDFKKAMCSIVLTAGATLTDAQRRIERASLSRRSKTQQDMTLVIEFCRLLIAPVEGHGPGFAHVPGLADSYCRKHLSIATDFLRSSLAAHGPGVSDCKRLAHIAGLIEKNLKQFLDEETAILCWFGDASTHRARKRDGALPDDYPSTEKAIFPRGRSF